MDQTTRDFVDDHNRVIEYDGSPVRWRMSVQAIIERDDSILLIKDRRQNFYSTPGGGIEVTESLFDALQREMLEEVGASVTVGSLLTVKQTRFYHRGLGEFYEALLFFFSATLDGPIGTASDENSEYSRFFPYSELSPLNLNSVVYQVLKELGRVA